MSTMRILLILFIALSFSACVRAPHYKSPQQQSLSDEHFKVATTVRTDAQDALVAFTTRPGFEQKQGPMARVKVDTFLRAYIDKKTRTRIFEVHQLIKYTDKKRRDYKTVEYQTARGPKSVGLTRLRSDAECVLTSDKECNYQEHIGFRVSGRLLSEIASSYDRDKGKAPSWSLKFVPLSGQDFQTRIMAAEIKGLLDKMSEYERAMM
jgi:hypothetical protein